MKDGAHYDLLIAGIAAVSLIFIIMLVITRSVCVRDDRRHRAAVLGASLACRSSSGSTSGLELHWMVLPMSVILLLAVGSDYNLLLVSRLKEELPGGLKTGIIRAMAGTGSVVTSLASSSRPRWPRSPSAT